MRVLGDRYVWKGKTLGGKSGHRQPGYFESLGWLVRESKTKNVCVMCMEADPDKCHRKRWISADIQSKYAIEATHILADSMRWKRKKEKDGTKQTRFASG